MTAHCELCRVLIIADVRPTRFNAEGFAAAEVAEFDLLALRMVNHIGQEHHEQMIEMLGCQAAAAKVYAMTWAAANSETVKFTLLREAWRKGVLMTFEAQHAQHLQAEGSALDPAGTGSADASNVKNESRKASI